MSDVATIQPGPVDGTVVAPPSKSVTHRAFLLAAQARDGCVVRNPLLAADTQAMLRCLAAMGASPTHEEGAVHFAPMPPDGFRPPSRILDCGNSATALRLLAATCARLAVPTTLDGDSSLRRRPHTALLSALLRLGCQVRSRDQCAPLVVRGPLRPANVAVAGSQGSQATSALLLALPFLPAASNVLVEKPVLSRPYLDITVDVARQAGLTLRVEDGEACSFEIPGGQHVTATALAVPGDWSSAAFLLSAGAVAGGRVTVQGLDARSPQGDRRIVELLQEFGANVKVSGTQVTCTSGPLVAPGRVDVGATPDLFPIACILAAASRGTTELAGAPHLRLKESDRVDAMAEGLAAMGIQATPVADGLRVVGGTIHAAALATHGDHRIHMAFAIAALAARGASRLDGAGSVAASFPGFHAALRSLGARVAVPEVVAA